MVRGEAGAGKSALLDFAAEIAGDRIVLRACGVPDETHLPYSGLHMLLATTRPHWRHLPAPQRDVLGHLGEQPDGPPAPVPGDRASGEPARPPSPHLPVWDLLRHLAGRRPVLCLIDDAHWLDRESSAVLSFCVRRLAAARVVILSAAEGELPALQGGDEMDLPGVDRQAALDIVAECGPGIVPQVRERIVGDACGNPLALRELAAGAGPAQAEGRLSPLGLYTGWRARSRRADQLYGERLRSLPERTRVLLLLAAADPAASLPELLTAAGSIPASRPALPAAGSVPVCWPELPVAGSVPASRPLAAGGATLADLEPAETAQLVEVRPAGLIPRHLLVLVAAYQSAPVFARAAAHRALAEASPERRAWHLAAAALAPDEEIARELEAIATASALERAAELTAAPEPRARRYAAAALAASDAGQLRRAADLAVRATELSAEPATLASAARVLATVESEVGSPARAARMLLDSAAGIGEDDPATAIAMIADAVRLSGYSGDKGLAAQIAAAVRPAPEGSPVLSQPAPEASRVLSPQVEPGGPPDPRQAAPEGAPFPRGGRGQGARSRGRLRWPGRCPRWRRSWPVARSAASPPSASWSSTHRPWPPGKPSPPSRWAWWPPTPTRRCA